jgi:hypothetical protein
MYVREIVIAHLNQCAEETLALVESLLQVEKEPSTKMSITSTTIAETSSRFTRVSSTVAPTAISLSEFRVALTNHQGSLKL